MKPRPRAPHSLLPPGITGRRPLRERDLIRGGDITEIVTGVKKFVSDKETGGPRLDDRFRMQTRHSCSPTSLRLLTHCDII